MAQEQIQLDDRNNLSAMHIARTVAHELAHGVFNLRQTFSDKNFVTLPQGTTGNLMDYPTSPALADRYTALIKIQWDLIHNPISTTGLFDGMEEGALSSEFKGTPVVFLGDTAIRKERLFIYNDTSKTVKVKFETADTSKTKVAFQLIITTEPNNIKLPYPKTGCDTLVFNEIKQIRLDSIPNGKYTLTCKVKVKTLKNKKEVESEKVFTTHFFIRTKKLEITTELLKSIFANNPDTVRLGRVARAINKYSEQFGLVNVNRMSHFLAQVGYESDGFKGKSGEGGCYTKTNTNWSIWFSLTWKERPFCNNCNCDTTLNLPIQRGSKKLKWTAVECKAEQKDCYAVPDIFICKKAGKEQDSLFLSYVYQCEGGNGNSSTGDGYKYRGHGAIQLTWKKTYQAFDEWLRNNYPKVYKNVVSNPSVIDKDEELFVLSALWFWSSEKKNKKLNDCADLGNYEEITRVISNSTKTVEERKKIFDKLIKT
ncbi:glycoside hydrolase family 19 protein [Tenuifilum thalassicum]|uniref:glycoside hydrolase family 19 protein n=1 Tax=Tenuifilum thalassicum TaxID=2590900 RepID=UPI0015664A15|nr:hypothetical protein [Tenuifilum thalassicum]